MIENAATLTSSRRHFLTSAAVGALLGAAWGTSFLKAEMRSREPTITVYRTPELVSMLIEMEPARVLLLDGTDAAAMPGAVESTMGFLRQRLDIVIASDPMLHHLPGEFMDRWNVSSIFAAPDSMQPLAEPLDDRAISIGDLIISAHAAPAGEWLAQPHSALRPWYLEISFRGASCIYCSSMELVRTVAPDQRATQAMSMTNDASSGIATNGALDIIAVPAELLESTGPSALAGSPAQLIRLFRDYPVSITLTENSITVPDEFMTG